ncbi:MAG TPA: ABC transporter permease [Vicinamibacterales bacterium]
MLRQMFAVLVIALRSMRQRLGSSAVTVAGVVGVVIVFVAILSITQGLTTAMRASSDPRDVLVLRAGSDTEMTSGFYLEHVRVIADAPGVAREDGDALASPELLVIVNQPLRRSGVDANVPMRGVLPIAFKVHDHLEIIAGRRFVPGRNEIIVGRAAQQQYAGLDLGATVSWGPDRWTVVGVFADDHSVAEGEIWCDAAVAQPVYHRKNSYQSVSVRLASADQFTRFKDALTTDPRLNVIVRHRSQYYAQQSEQLRGVIRNVGFVVVGLMGLCAVFVAVNTIYTAVASRSREIAMLRALGFGPLPVVVSVFAEAIVLSVIGGAIGGAIAYLAFDGFQTSTFNMQALSQVAFAFSVTPALIGEGMACAVVLGLLGGALPAVRAARLPIVLVLREP